MQDPSNGSMSPPVEQQVLSEGAATPACPLPSSQGSPPTASPPSGLGKDAGLSIITNPMQQQQMQQNATQQQFAQDYSNYMSQYFYQAGVLGGAVSPMLPPPSATVMSATAGYCPTPHPQIPVVSQPDVSRTLSVQVQGLSFEIQFTNEDLKKVFSRYGTVRAAQTDPVGRTGYVTFETREEAQAAFEKLQGKRLNVPTPTGEGASLKLDWYVPVSQMLDSLWDPAHHHTSPNAPNANALTSPPNANAQLGLGGQSLPPQIALLAAQQQQLNALLQAAQKNTHTDPHQPPPPAPQPPMAHRQLGQMSRAESQTAGAEALAAAEALAQLDGAARLAEMVRQGQVALPTVPLEAGGPGGVASSGPMTPEEFVSRTTLVYANPGGGAPMVILRRNFKGDAAPAPVEASEVRKWTCRFDVGIENDREFHVARRLIGTKGLNMKRIFKQTDAKIRLRGRGSGYLEGTYQQESPEPLHICVSSKTFGGYELACRMVADLLQQTRNEFASFCRETSQPCPELGAPVMREHLLLARSPRLGPDGEPGSPAATGSPLDGPMGHNPMGGMGGGNGRRPPMGGLPAAKQQPGSFPPQPRGFPAPPQGGVPPQGMSGAQLVAPGSTSAMQQSLLSQINNMTAHFATALASAAQQQNGAGRPQLTPMQPGSAGQQQGRFQAPADGAYPKTNMATARPNLRAGLRPFA